MEHITRDALKEEKNVEKIRKIHYSTREIEEVMGKLQGL